MTLYRPTALIRVLFAMPSSHTALKHAQVAQSGETEMKKVTKCHFFPLSARPGTAGLGSNSAARYRQGWQATFSIYAQVAQSVEQGTENPRVGGSIPPLGTINKIN